MSSPRSRRELGSCREPPGAAGSCREPSGASQESRQEPPGAVRSRQGDLGAVRSSPRSRRELSGAARRRRELLGGESCVKKHAVDYSSAVLSWAQGGPAQAKFKHLLSAFSGVDILERDVWRALKSQAFFVGE